MGEAAQVADIAGSLDIRRRPCCRFADVRLRGLLALLQADPRGKAFAEAQRAPPLDGQDPAALDLLELYLDHGVNKSALARTRYLSRPPLCARPAKLQDLVGESLDDAESRVALRVAPLWHRQRETGPGSAP